MRIIRHITTWLAVLLAALILMAPVYALELGSGQEHKTVETQGEFIMPVPGSWTVGPGPANIPLQFYYRDKESSMMARVVRTDPESIRFINDWLSTAQYLEREARRRYGDLLGYISFDSISSNKPGEQVYVMYYELDNKQHRIGVTACFRFSHNFTAEYIGINLGDMPEMFSYTKEAAQLFQDTSSPDYPFGPSFYSTGEFTADPGPWELPVNNVYAVVNELVRWYYPQQLSEDRKATDYEIQWVDPSMELIARDITRKASGPIYASDLDLVYSLTIQEREWNTPGAYSYYSDDTGGVSFDADPIVDISDIAHFQNLTTLRLELTTVTDISPLAALDKVESVNLYLSPELTDLSPLSGMVSLNKLMMWGQDYPGVTDISFFGELKELETVYFIASSIKDASVFCQIPNLRQLYLNAHDDLDKQPLIDCKTITSLMLNAETIR